MWLQELPATITGRVTNSAGFGIADVEVQALNSDTGAKLSTHTDAEGLYRITNLEPGKYQLTLQKYGFRPVIRSGVELHMQDVLAINLDMNIGTPGESVTDVDGAPLIRAENTLLGLTYSGKAISELPSLRTNPYSFAGLSAGAAPLFSGDFAGAISDSFPERHAGIGLAVNGQRPESATFLLDGADNMNANQNTPLQLVPNDAVSEYRIVTNGAAAEYGGSAGLVVNLITKSGGSEFHGSLYDYARTSRFAPNSFENNARGKPRDVFSSHQAGASLGGPVWRDKTSFFIAYEAIRIRSSGSIQGYIPTPQLAAISSPSTRTLLSRYRINTSAPPAFSIPDLSRNDVLIRTVTPFGGSSPVSVPAFTLATRVGPTDTGAGVPQNRAFALFRLDYGLNSRTKLTASSNVQGFTSMRMLSQPYGPEFDSYTQQEHKDLTFTLTRTWSAEIVSDSRLETRSVYFFTPEIGSLLPKAGPCCTVLDQYPPPSVMVLNEKPLLPTGAEEFSMHRSVSQMNHVFSLVHRRHFFKFGGEVVH